MNTLRAYTAMAAVCAASIIFTGCGDDDDIVAGNPTPTQNAPQSLNGQTYALSPSDGGNATLAFNAAGDTYSYTPNAGIVETGAFTAQQSGDVWNVQLSSTHATNSVLALTFASASAGSYSWNVDGTNHTGTFASTTTGPGPDPDPDPNPDPDPGIPAPASLSSITVTTGPGGGIGAGTVYTVNFSGGTSGTFTSVNASGDPMGSGNFVYTPSGNQATLTMTYPDFGNDRDDMTLLFTKAAGSGQPNQYTGTQIVTGTQYPFNGTFTY